MGKIIKFDKNEIKKPDDEGLLSLTENLLEETRMTITEQNSISVPIAALGTLGAGVSSLIPALNTVTKTTSIATDGLYRVANAVAGDVLKQAKNGNFWGAMKTAEGASKMAQLTEVGSLSATTQTVAAVNPATMMMAVALYSIEKELAKIEDMQKQIISFLQIEKEAEVEADIETLMATAKKYKQNWNNERYVASNHKQMLDIQRTARKNMIAYQKQVEEILDKKKLIMNQGNVKQTFTDLKKKFKYYQLSLYSYSLSSLMEIMLSGNFKEEYITGIKNEILDRQSQYRNLFDKGSLYLEKLSGSALDKNLLKGVGNAEKAVGKFIGSIPLIKEGKLDEFLQESGEKIKQNALGMENKSVYSFAAINNPGTGMIVDKMNDMIQIYNHTEQICFDNQKIYLVQGNATA